jgi:SPX domain protein involved in polyphosphate accumulation
MKYGAELSKRSIPEWKAYNLDYNEMKTLIRAATTPSSNHEQRVDFFFNSLAKQLDNIELFIKSKSGETNLRLVQCEKIVSAINKTIGIEENNSNNNTNMPIPPHLKRKLKVELLQLSTDLQNLTRFIGVQRNGFRKLLKKYRKWLPNAHVSAEQEQLENDMIERFNLDLYNPDTYLNRDFSQVFQQLSDLYNFLRDGCHPQVLPAGDVNAKFDSDMILQHTSNSLTFWIHPDNVMETKILLLKNLSIVQSSAHEASSEQDESSTPSTQRLSDSYVSSAMQVTYLDDSLRSAYLRRAEPGQLRFIAPDAAYLCAPVGGLRQFCITPVASQQVKSILTTDYSTLQKSIADTSDRTLKMAAAWVATKRARPACKVDSSRIRFKYEAKPAPDANFNSLGGTEIWASIDSDIRYTTANLDSSSPLNENDAGVEAFPYSVLQIKWRNLEEGKKPKWLQDLETSHLVYAVRGFSFFLHALATGPEATGTRPEWMPLFDNETDIRKTPVRPAVRREKTPPTQTSILLNQGTAQASGGYGAVPSAPGYWNEFDHPEDPDEGFYITIPDSESYSDEDSLSGIFSEANVDYLLTLTDRAYTKIAGTFSNWFGRTPESPPKRQRSLSIIYEEPEDDEEEFHDYHYKQCNHSPHSSTSSTWSGYSSTSKFHAGFYNYPEYPSKRRRQRDSILAVLYTTCFTLAALAVATLLAVLASFHNNEFEALSWMTVFFIASGIILAVAVDFFAMVLYLWRTDIPTSIIHQMLVYFVFFGVVCIGIGEICWLVT